MMSSARPIQLVLSAEEARTLAVALHLWRARWAMVPELAATRDGQAELDRVTRLLAEVSQVSR